MSITALNWAFRQDIDPTHKFVLIALANRHYAADGRLDPTIDQLCLDTGHSRSTVIRALDWLRQHNYCERQRRGPTSSSYTLKIDENRTAEKCQPDTSFEDENDAEKCQPDTSRSVTLTPPPTPPLRKPEDEPEEVRARAHARANVVDMFDEPATPKRKPPPKAKSKGEAILAALNRVITTERAHAVVEHRLALGKKLTTYAASLLARQLERAPLECGISADQAADTMIERGWRGFRSEWVINDRQRNGHGGRDRPETDAEYAMRMLKEHLDGNESADPGSGLFLASKSG